MASESEVLLKLIDEKSSVQALSAGAVVGVDDELADRRVTVMGTERGVA